MSLFSAHSASVRYGAVIEIGSGSVLVAIVSSDAAVAHPDILWSAREFANITIDQDAARSIKSMLTALMNAMMVLDSEGRSALKNIASGAKITHLQISIAAPFAYTMSRVTEYEHDEPFTITDDILSTLATTAAQKTLESLSEIDPQGSGTIAIMTRATTNITVNGYATMEPLGQRANAVSLTQVSAVAQTLITAAIDDLRNRLFPRTVTERYSSMLILHCIVRDLYPTMSEYCLIDLTYEATEIAIIRNGVLQYSTHTTIGLNTIVRNLSAKLDIPEGDARTLLKNIYEADSKKDLTERERTALNSIMTEYVKELESLFHETGDSLSVPRLLFLHSNYFHERFFDDYLLQGAKAATGSTHTIHDVSHDLLMSRFSKEEEAAVLASEVDTATLMAAQFFHKQQHCNDFVQV